MKGTIYMGLALGLPMIFIGIAVFLFVNINEWIRLLLAILAIASLFYFGFKSSEAFESEYIKTSSNEGGEQ